MSDSLSYNLCKMYCIQVSPHHRCPLITGVPSSQVSPHHRCPLVTGVPSSQVSPRHRVISMLLKYNLVNRKCNIEISTGVPWDRFYCIYLYTILFVNILLLKYQSLSCIIMWISAVEGNSNKQKNAYLDRVWPGSILWQII